MTKLEQMAIYQWSLNGPSFRRWAKTVLPFFDGIVVWDLPNAEYAQDQAQRHELELLASSGLLRTLRPASLLSEKLAQKVADFLQHEETFIDSSEDNWPEQRYAGSRDAFMRPPNPGLVDWDITYARRYFKPPVVSKQTISLAREIWPALEAHLPGREKGLRDSIARQPFAWSSISAVLPYIVREEAQKLGISLQCVTYDHGALHAVTWALKFSEGRTLRQATGAEQVACDGDDVSLVEILDYRSGNGVACREYLVALKERATSVQPRDVFCPTAIMHQNLLLERAERIRRALRSSLKNPFRYLAIGMVAVDVANELAQRGDASLGVLLRDEKYSGRSDLNEFSCLYLVETPSFFT